MFLNIFIFKICIFNSKKFLFLPIMKKLYRNNAPHFDPGTAKFYFSFLLPTSIRPYGLLWKLSLYWLVAFACADPMLLELATA